MLKKLIEDKKYAFIFVTLTSPNVTAEIRRRNKRLC